MGKHGTKQTGDRTRVCGESGRREAGLPSRPSAGHGRLMQPTPHVPARSWEGGLSTHLGLHVCCSEW